MRTVAAIDIGSNAIRLVLGEVDDHGDIRILKKIREPVRLGKDVFALGEISAATVSQAIETFTKFRDFLRSSRVDKTKAVATSAVREAKNREAFIDTIRKSTGIEIEVIDGIEEGRLIFSAVSHRVHLADKVALLIDIGGGSVELTVSDHGEIRASQTFRLGTVRLLQMLEEKKLKEKHFEELIRELMGPVRSFLSPIVKELAIDTAIGTGGNFECLGKLRVALLHKNSIFSMSRNEVGTIVDHLRTMSVKERIQYLRLRPDRADVVVPAALVTQAIMEEAQTELLMIPYVGLRDGILADLGYHQGRK